MTNALRGIGVVLKVGDGASPEVFAAIAEVRNISGPGLSASPIDVTNQDSPGQYREFIQGTKDGGEVTFDITSIPDNSSHDATSGLLSKFDTGDTDNYQLEFPTSPATQWSFSAFLTGFTPSANPDEALSASVTLKVVGEPTLA